jgi:spore coat protein CotH
MLVSMGIIDNGSNRNTTTDVWNNYNAKVLIHLRGNSTKNFEKKSYSIETHDASGIKFTTSILGMPLETDWDLLAPYQDKSLIRIPLTYDLFRKMGHYASRFKNVEVVLNNEYQGVYAVAEKPKRDQNRIDVSKLTLADNSFPNITGGYIFKIDRSDAPGWSSLFAGDSPNGSHFYYQYVYPKDSDITAPQQTYIKSFVDTFETVMSSPSFADPLIGYPKYIDVGSFIDFFIINELSKNVDAYRLSTYMYKDKITKGGKLHIGPVWDYDIAWHNCNYGNAFDANFWQYQIRDTAFPTPSWWKRFMQDPNFVNNLYCRWNELRQGILSNNYLYSYIDSSANALNESQLRNFIQWPVLGTYIYPNPQNQWGANYQGEVNDLKTWIANRTGWMDGAITGHCLSGIEENSIDNNVVVYPNPSNGMFNVQCLWASTPSGMANGNTSTIDIYNVLGEKIFTSTITHQPLPIDFSSQPTGMYFYQLKINGAAKAGKIIIQ